jgi:hypothetical protein
MMPSDAGAWDEFVERSLNGTLFHTKRFLEYHPAERFAWDHASLPADTDPPLALWPAAATDGGATWHSGVGASYGGPVVAADATADSCREVVAEILEEARRRGYRRVKLTPPPPLYEKGAGGLVRAALVAAGFQCVASDVSQSVPLSEKPPPDLLVPKARRGASKAEREGVQVKKEEAYGAFHVLLTADRGEMGLTPTHSEAELTDLATRLGSNQTLLLARREGELVAGAWLLQLNGRVGLSFYVCQDRAHRRLRSTNLLMLRALEWAAERGLAELDLGTSSVGGKVNEGLSDFKAAHGARRFSRETFERALP